MPRRGRRIISQTAKGACHVTYRIGWRNPYRRQRRGADPGLAGAGRRHHDRLCRPPRGAADPRRRGGPRHHRPNRDAGPDRLASALHRQRKRRRHAVGARRRHPQDRDRRAAGARRARERTDHRGRDLALRRGDPRRGQRRDHEGPAHGVHRPRLLPHRRTRRLPPPAVRDVEERPPLGRPGRRSVGAPSCHPHAPAREP